jgi:hypothetical protein
MKTYLCIKSSNYYSLWFKSAGTIPIQAGHQSRHGLRHTGTKSSETPQKDTRLKCTKVNVLICKTGSE